MEEAEVSFAEVADGDAGAKVNVASRKHVGCRCNVFASAKWALALFSFANMMQQLVVNGLYSVVVSTLEKRFELRSTETGIIASCFGIAAFITTIFVAFANEDVHKAKRFSRGTFLIGIGIFLFAVPHFIAPIYTLSETSNIHYCSNVTEPKCSTSSSIRDYRHLFSVSIALMGAGSCFQHAYGISYLDENVSKDDSAFFNAIFFAVTGLGAALGFVMGGASLNYYTYITTSVEDLTVDSSSDLWVGAWWLCFIISGTATLLISIPIHMFPRHLPGTERFRENRDSEMQRNAVKENGEIRRSFTRSKSDFLILLKNKPYLLVTLATAVNCALIFGFNTFGAKYLETVFGVTAFHASMIYGACIIVASLAGQTAGGYFIKCMSLTVRGIIKFVIAGGVFSALCSFGFLLYCPEIDIAGATVPYPNTTFTLSPISQCNMNCSCSTDLYLPVCSEEMIYFSPCFAGCTEKINETTYGSCSCVRGQQVASTTECERNACPAIYPFVVAVFLCFFSSILTISPALQITLRCVSFDKRILALSVQRMVVLSMGVVPGRLLVGFVMDLACVSWGTDCGQRGTCRAYRRWDLAKNNTILLVAQTIEVVFVSFIEMAITLERRTSVQGDNDPFCYIALTVLYTEAICAVLYVLVYVTYEPVESATEHDEDMGERPNKITETKAGQISETADTTAVEIKPDQALLADREQNV